MGGSGMNPMMQRMMRMRMGMGAGMGMRPDMGAGMGFQRRFVSREEIAARLEEYLKQLQAEAKAVEERISALRSGGAAAGGTKPEQA